MAKIVKLQGKLFVINLTWYDFNSVKELEKKANFLKLNYGLSFTRHLTNDKGFKVKKTLACLTDKTESSCYSLAALVANKLQSGIFITDKLIMENNSDIAYKQYWICIFNNREVLSNISITTEKVQLQFNGDQIVKQEELELLIKSYTKTNNTSIFVDLIDEQSLNIPNVKIRLLEELVSNKVSHKYLIKKLHNHYAKYALVGGLILILAISGVVFSYHNHSHKKATIKKVVKVKPKVSAETVVLKDIQTNNAGLILNSINHLLHSLPVMIAGWKIQSITYSSAYPNLVEIQYKKELGNIINAKAKASDFIEKYNFQNPSIQFSKNDEIMQLTFNLDEDNSKFKALTQRDIKSSINTSQAIETIAAIQSNFFNYRLSDLKAVNAKYSKQVINISNIDAPTLQRLISVVKNDENLVVSSLIGKFGNSFTSSWIFKGAIYE
ncbi:type 4b pilus protein PilO2 [Francisella sp. SYW-9]|uniref:type 4b pilus protein PilO2 n=1 Tax=Francisella sp. SYW-9 TaxID=2610888 RepID=UPI00123DE586|nr:type 4b pilus protein PilO2 [Francisella sp. SYW-9]